MYLSYCCRVKYARKALANLNAISFPAFELNVLITCDIADNVIAYGSAVVRICLVIRPIIKSILQARNWY